MEWITVWRLDRFTCNPEQVRVLPVSGNFVLPEGDDHTAYKGNFFATPEKAFAAARADAERSIKYGRDQLERLERARERFEKGALK